jgi:hypothetical protein
VKKFGRSRCGTLESIKQELANIYHAFNQVKDEAHSLDDKIYQYLDGGNGNSKFPALKNLIIAINLIGQYTLRRFHCCLSQINNNTNSLSQINSNE